MTQPAGDIPVGSGALTAWLAGGGLRDIRLLGYRALDAVYVAIRDPHWNTVPGVVSNLQYAPRPGGFTASWDSRHTGRGIDFGWRGSIEADQQEIRVRVDGQAFTEFDARRIGVCLLHPAELTGAAVQVSFPGGKTGTTSFPPQISPGPVLTGATGLGYEAGPGAQLEMGVTGGLLETEDHRNWTDSGWKTYTPPLGEPALRRMRPGDRITQAVRLTGVTVPGAAAARPETNPVELRLGDADGVMPAVGMVLAGGTEPELRSLARMSPAIVHTGLEAGDSWRSRLELAAGQAAALGARLSVALAGDDPAWLHACSQALAELPHPPAAVGVFAAPDGIASPEAGRIVRRELRRAHPATLVGSGSILHFAELNRSRSRDPDWDFVAFPVTAQAHHSSDRPIMITILGQEPAVRGASFLAGGRPVVAGPVSLRPRVTPSTPASPDDPRDPRESEPVGAAWLCASVVSMHTAGMILFLNPLGAAAGPFSPQADVERLVAGLSGLAGQPVRRVHGDWRRVAALAVRRAGRPPLLVAASLTPDPLTIRLGQRTWPLPGYGTVIAGDTGTADDGEMAGGTVIAGD